MAKINGLILMSIEQIVAIKSGFDIENTGHEKNDTDGHYYKMIFYGEMSEKIYLSILTDKKLIIMQYNSEAFLYFITNTITCKYNLVDDLSLDFIESKIDEFIKLLNFMRSLGNVKQIKLRYSDFNGNLELYHPRTIKNVNLSTTSSDEINKVFKTFKMEVCLYK